MIFSPYDDAAEDKLYAAFAHVDIFLNAHMVKFVACDKLYYFWII